MGKRHGSERSVDKSRSFEFAATLPPGRPSRLEIVPSAILGVDGPSGRPAFEEVPAA